MQKTVLEGIFWKNRSLASKIILNLLNHKKFKHIKLVRQKFSTWIRIQKPAIRFLQEPHVKYKDIEVLKGKG